MFFISALFKNTSLAALVRYFQKAPRSQISTYQHRSVLLITEPHKTNHDFDQTKHDKFEAHSRHMIRNFSTCATKNAPVKDDDEHPWLGCDEVLKFYPAIGNNTSTRTDDEEGFFIIIIWSSWHREAKRYHGNMFISAANGGVWWDDIITLARIRCFATFGRTGGGGCDPPLGVSKRSVVELNGKDQQTALAEYSRLVVLFLVLGQYLTQLWQVKGQIFGNYIIFQLHEAISAKLSIVAAWDLHQRVPRSILHQMRCFDASRLNI